MIFIVSGPGGVGKGTLVNRLVERDPSLWLSKSWTTRPRRDGESPGAYEFVDTGAFMERVNNNGFLEWVNFLGHLYGTPTPEGTDGRDVILEIELQGARKVKELHPKAVLILVVPPSTEAQVERLRIRGEDEDRIAERVEVGQREMESGRLLADEVLVNDDLESATVELGGIVAQHRRTENS